MEEKLKSRTCLNMEGCSGWDTMGWDDGAAAGTLEWAWVAGGACEAAGGAWEEAGAGAGEGAGGFDEAVEEWCEEEERPCRGILKKL